MDRLAAKLTIIINGSFEPHGWHTIDIDCKDVLSIGV